MKTPLTLIAGLFMLHMHAQTPAPQSWPQVSINGKTSGLISRADVASASRLVVIRSDGSIDPSLKVVSFQLSLWTTNKNPVSDSIPGPGLPKGDSLTQSMRQWILSQPTGAIIYIEYVQTQMTSGAFRKLPPGRFELSD